jgi:hypothetical protein
VSVCVGDGGVGKEIIVFEVTLMLCVVRDGIGDERDEEVVVVRLFARSMLISSLKIVVVVCIVVRPLKISSPASPPRLSSP